VPLVGLGAWFSKKPSALLIFGPREYVRIGKGKLRECLGADTRHHADKH
jgi:hypothetical protein